MSLRQIFVASVSLVALLCSQLVVAQQPPASPVEKEHQWLRQFVGTWETHSEGMATGTEPAMKCKGKISSKMLGEYWVINEIEGDMGGTVMKGIQTIGYDSQKKKFVGTWVDSMMNFMWQYEGTLDETGKILTLEAKGPNFMAEGKMTLFRDAYEIKSPGHIIATSSMQTEDGKWVTFMTGDSKRTKE